MLSRLLIRLIAGGLAAALVADPLLASPGSRVPGHEFNLEAITMSFSTRDARLRTRDCFDSQALAALARQFDSNPKPRVAERRSETAESLRTNGRITEQQLEAYAAEFRQGRRFTLELLGVQGMKGVIAQVSARDGTKHQGFIPASEAGSYQNVLSWLVERESIPGIVISCDPRADKGKLYLKFRIVDDLAEQRQKAYRNLDIGEEIYARINRADSNGLYGFNNDSIPVFVPLSTVGKVLGFKPTFDYWREKIIVGDIDKKEDRRVGLVLHYHGEAGSIIRRGASKNQDDAPGIEQAAEVRARKAFQQETLLVVNRPEDLNQDPSIFVRARVETNDRNTNELNIILMILTKHRRLFDYFQELVAEAKRKGRLPEGLARIRNALLVHLKTDKGYSNIGRIFFEPRFVYEAESKVVTSGGPAAVEPGDIDAGLDFVHGPDGSLMTREEVEQAIGVDQNGQKRTTNGGRRKKWDDTFGVASGGPAWWGKQFKIWQNIEEMIFSELEGLDRATWHLRPYWQEWKNALANLLKIAIEIAPFEETMVYFMLPLERDLPDALERVKQQVAKAEEEAESLISNYIGKLLDDHDVSAENMKTIRQIVSNWVIPLQSVLVEYLNEELPEAVFRLKLKQAIEYIFLKHQQYNHKIFQANYWNRFEKSAPGLYLAADGWAEKPFAIAVALRRAA